MIARVKHCQCVRPIRPPDAINTWLLQLIVVNTVKIKYLFKILSIYNYYNNDYLYLSPTGSKIVGVHCHFDPMTLLDAMELVKDGLTKAKLNDVHMMVQPLGFHTPDASKQGFIDLPEFPFGTCVYGQIYCISLLLLLQHHCCAKFCS